MGYFVYRESAFFERLDRAFGAFDLLGETEGHVFALLEGAFELTSHRIKHGYVSVKPNRRLWCSAILCVAAYLRLGGLSRI